MDIKIDEHRERLLSTTKVLCCQIDFYQLSNSIFIEISSKLKFTFSDRIAWRLARHGSFWLCWYLFQVSLYIFSPSPILLRVSFIQRIHINVVESFWFIFPNMFLAYLLIYLVIPRLILPAKYLGATICIILLALLTAVFSSLISVTIIEHLRQNYLMSHPEVFGGLKLNRTPIEIQIFQAIIAGLRGSITIGGLAAAIKLAKYFYQKQQHASELESRQVLSELQSLKAQLHPHFLFNTINNIYSHAQPTAPLAAGMLLQLVTLLRYILYSSSQKLVPLSKELAMISDYIALEKQRYGNELEIGVTMPENVVHLLVGPLMILPLIENCFKHGTSSMIERPWLTLTIGLVDNKMSVHIVNGKARIPEKSVVGIGLENLKRRLELLYPDNHLLTITDEEEVYIVNLEIPVYGETDI